MIATVRYLVVVGVVTLAFGSCTCHRDLPEPEAAFEHRTGFSAALPTARPLTRATVALRLSQITPKIPTVPLPADTPTPAEVTLPEDFPEDVPLFTGSELFGVQKVGHEGHTVLFRVDAAASEVFNYYHENMPTKGWKVSQEYQAPHQSFLSFQKGKTITNMTVAKDPKTGKQVVAIMYYEERDLPFPEF